MNKRDVWNFTKSSAGHFLDGEAIPKILTAIAVQTAGKKVSGLFSAASIAYSFADFSIEKYREMRMDREYLVTIDEEDPLFATLRGLMVSSRDSKEVKVVHVSSKPPVNPRNGSVPDDSGNAPVVSSEVSLLSGAGEAFIDVKGHVVRFMLSTGALPDVVASGAQRSGSDRQQVFASKTITIFCKNAAAKEAVVAYLNELLSNLAVRPPRYYQATRWGSFRYVRDTPVRPRNSVVLKEGQMDRIFKNLQTFLSSEDEYVRLGIPYRTGLLLEGSPGTGKTSVASVIAHELGLDVYFVALSTVENDTDLMDMLQDIKPRSVLLLEDIDVAHAATERSDTQQGITMSGLLNALDGIATPHGLVTIMTTNHSEVLDDALIRPGRVDTRELISEIDNYQLNMLCWEFLGEIPDDLPVITEAAGVVAADIMEIFKRNLKSKDEVANDLRTFITKKVKDASHV